MTASTPPASTSALKSSRRDPKRKITGPVPIAPAPSLSSSDFMNGLGKTATRSKSGCMTCRIRRKKCDQERIEDSCKTCLRLRIECLGWGAKRPEALRDPAVVKQIQAMIKIHLASNNMIKGSAKGAIPLPDGPYDEVHHESSFLRFDNLRLDGPGEFPPPMGMRKGKGRFRHHDDMMEGEDDGSGEDDYDDNLGGGPNDGHPSSFSRHPPGFTPPYESLNYRPRYPYPGNSPPRSGQFSNLPTSHPYAPQSNLRTASYDYDGADRRFQIDESLRDLEREREMDAMRHGGDMLSGRIQPPFDPNLNSYPPPFPNHSLLYGPGVGVASAGRQHPGYGHAGYRGPSPGITLNPSFVPQPSPFRSDSFAAGGPRSGVLPPLGSNLSLSVSRIPPPSGDPYPLEAAVSANAFSSPTLSRPSRNSTSGGQAPGATEEGDVDGEPMMPIVQPTHQPTQTFNNPHLPSGSSYGTLYNFDRQFIEMEPEQVTNGSLVPFSNSNSLIDGQNVPVFDSAMLESLLNAIGVSDISDVSRALNVVDPLSALTQLTTPNPALNLLPTYPAQFGNSQSLSSSPRQMELLHLWRKDLCHVQYHIAHSTDATIADELFNLAMQSESALYGALTLTSLYNIRLRGVHAYVPVPDEELSEVRGFKEKVAAALDEKKRMPQLVDSGDAMAGLFMVSAVLFEGGTVAQWDNYLDMAKIWVQNHPVVKNGSWASSLTIPGHNGVPVIDRKAEFIIKTTAWFDILGSITMRRAPFFLSIYRQLFGQGSGAGMERIMGCNENVLLAIAETADLAKWRYDMEAKGCLSNPELCARSAEIQRRLEFVGPSYDGSTFVQQQTPTMDDVDDILRWSSSPTTSSSASKRQEESHTIRLVSNVFRATGKLYLHTVLSNCNPNVREIKEAVRETVDAFKCLHPSDVDKSLVFPICLAGCLTDEPQYRTYLVERLKALGKQGEAVGNTKSCLQLMQEVWKRRDSPGGPRIVDWIGTMKDMGWSLLLV